MNLFEDLPYPSERMGILWSLGTVEGACVLEFGPEGSTHYAAAQHGTYNAKMNAALFTTGLTEKEVVFGDPDLLETAMQELIQMHRPSHLFVVPSAVSEIIGMDVESLCRRMCRETGTPVICIGNISLNSDHTVGVERVLSLLAEHVVQNPIKSDPCSYNVIGSVMDCFNYRADLKEIERLMKNAFGFSPKAVFTADTSMGQLASAGEAACNIVFRHEGIPCAEILKGRFGQPFFHGIPYGIEGTRRWLEAVGTMVNRAPSAAFIRQESLETREFADRLAYHKRIARSLRPSVVVCGGLDLLENGVPFLRDELQLEIKGAVLNHPVRSKPADEILFFRNDTEKYDYIAAQSPHLLLADAVTLRHFKGRIPGTQVANPNLGAMRLYAHMPLMGFRGAQVLVQELANLLLTAN